MRTLASIRALQSLIQTETFEWEQATSDENWLAFLPVIFGESFHLWLGLKSHGHLWL